MNCDPTFEKKGSGFWTNLAMAAVMGAQKQIPKIAAASAKAIGKEAMKQVPKVAEATGKFVVNKAVSKFSSKPKVDEVPLVKSEDVDEGNDNDDEDEDEVPIGEVIKKQMTKLNKDKKKTKKKPD